MEVHKELGMGFKEIIYKDALEIEFRHNVIPYEREKLFKIEYKGIVLPRKYPADFVIYDQIILEVKSSSMIVNNFVAQTINYLKLLAYGWVSLRILARVHLLTRELYSRFS